MIGSCNCPITANCPITNLQITAVYATITFEEIAIVVISIVKNMS